VGKCRCGGEGGGGIEPWVWRNIYSPISIYPSKVNVLDLSIVTEVLGDVVMEIWSFVTESHKIPGAGACGSPYGSPVCDLQRGKDGMDAHDEQRRYPVHPRGSQHDIGPCHHYPHRTRRRRKDQHVRR
jgi:hypothetical protein